MLGVYSGFFLTLSFRYDCCILHVPLHRVMDILRCAYQLQVIPLGLNINPWAFTTVMNCVVTLFRSTSLTGTAVYLDDILQTRMSSSALLKGRNHLISLITSSRLSCELGKVWSLSIPEFGQSGYGVCRRFESGKGF